MRILDVLTGYQLAIRAPSAQIARDLHLTGIRIESGEVDLAGIAVKGTLTLAEARLAAGTVLDLSHAVVGTFVAAADRPPDVLDLSGATVDTIRDDPDAWPDRIVLNGLTYRNLEPALPAARRLSWLARNPGTVHSQPYEQLAGHYRSLGQDGDARATLLNRHRRQRHHLPPLARAWSFLEDAAVGYGYQPVRALLLLLALATATAAVFAAHPPTPVPPGTRAFQPFAYALDPTLPILDLGQEKAFTPEGLTQWIAWTAAVAGWVLATAVIAAATRRLARP